MKSNQIENIPSGLHTPIFLLLMLNGILMFQTNVPFILQKLIQLSHFEVVTNKSIVGHVDHEYSRFNLLNFTLAKLLNDIS